MPDTPQRKPPENPDIFELPPPSQVSDAERARQNLQTQSETERLYGGSTYDSLSKLLPLGFPKVDVGDPAQKEPRKLQLDKLPLPMPLDNGGAGGDRQAPKYGPQVRRVGHSEVESVDSRSVKLDDGTYKRDESGRVTEMISADGKTKRAFKYEDAAHPNRVTSETINDKTTYKYIGPVTVYGKQLEQEGHEVNSFSIYENGQLIGNWAGIRDVSKNGVYSVRESGDINAVRREGASGVINEEQRAARERDGIWPSRINIEHADGTKYVADLKGVKLDSLRETSRTADGKTKETVWKREGGKFVSDDVPPRERKSMEVRRDGTLKYEETNGITHVKYKDGSRDVIEAGAIRHYDENNRVTKITQQNGESRSFAYGTDGQLSSITDQSKNGKSTWTRNGDEWTNGDRKETRKDLRINDDGSLEYKRENGNKVRETKDFSKVEFDEKNRPVKVEFESGSRREFKYDGDKLKSITDVVKRDGKESTKTVTRQGETDKFVDEADPKKRERTISGAPTADGDYQYKSSDGKERQSRARELERQARGEAVSGSESFQEAKEDLLDACRLKGIDTDRFGGWIDEFEKNATKYGLKEEQLSKTLDNLRDVLQSGKSPLYNEKQLKTVVETAMHNIARPMEIDQGAHPTCNVTTVEIYAAARHPDEYSRMCKEIATTGKYKTSDGRTVSPPVAALRPGEDESSYDLNKPNTEKRNLASQIVEMTLINGLYELGGVVKDENGRKIPQTDTRYVLDKSYWVDIGNNMKQKVGEDRLSDLCGNLKQVKDNGPGFTQTEVLASCKMMIGYEMPYINNPISADGGQTWKFDYPTADRLLKHKQNNTLPLGVPTLAGNHVQTIHDVSVDSKGTCWVLLDNQHGEKKDGWVTLQDLYRTQSDRNYECEPSIRRWQRPPR